MPSKLAASSRRREGIWKDGGGGASPCLRGCTDGIATGADQMARGAVLYYMVVCEAIVDEMARVGDPEALKQRPCCCWWEEGDRDVTSWHPSMGQLHGPPHGVSSRPKTPLKWTWMAAPARYRVRCLGLAPGACGDPPDSRKLVPSLPPELQVCTTPRSNASYVRVPLGASTELESSGHGSLARLVSELSDNRRSHTDRLVVTFPRLHGGQAHTPVTQRRHGL